MEPKFAQVLESVCREPAASGGAAAAAPAPPQQQRELPPITSSRQELLALPVSRSGQGLSVLAAGRAAPPGCFGTP